MNGNFLKASPLILSIILLACVGCTSSEASVQTAIALTRAEMPTDTSIPHTATPTITLPPSPTFTLTATQTLTPSPTPSKFFTEEFDQPLNEHWAMQIYGPNKKQISKVKSQVKDGDLEVKITGENIYVYYFYDQFSYTNVRLDMRAENSGRRSNNISLICRKSDEGWYEFSVGSDAVWYLFYAYISKNTSNTMYTLIASGATLALKQGSDTNEFTMICDGEKITMMVNGMELIGSPVRETIYKLKGGSVGMNVSSLSVTPVIVDVEWLKISQP